MQNLRLWHARSLAVLDKAAMALRPKTWPPSNALYTAAADYLCIDGAEGETPAEPPATQPAAVTGTAAAAATAAAHLAQYYSTAPSADSTPLAVLCSASSTRLERFCRHFGRAGSVAPSQPSPDELEEEAQTCSLDEANEVVLAAAQRHLSKQLDAAHATAATTQRRLVCVHRAVHCNGVLRGRPASAAEARRFLGSGVDATVVVGVAVADTSSSARADGTASARVALQALPRAAIDDALTRRAVLEAAGALAIDDAAIVPFARIESGTDDVAGGLPLALVGRLLERVRGGGGGGDGAKVEAEAEAAVASTPTSEEAETRKKKKKKRQKVSE